MSYFVAPCAFSPRARPVGKAGVQGDAERLGRWVPASAQGLSGENERQAL